MQILTFTVAGAPYAIPSRTVIEVLPLVPARPIPLMPLFIRGIFTYRGRLVPLVDLGRRFAAVAAADGRPDRLSTRVIVVEFAAPGAGAAQLVRLGLVADNVVSIRAAEEADSSTPEMALNHAPFLGQVLRLGGQTVQMIAVERLLPPDLLAGLFPAPARPVDDPHLEAPAS
jgi:chemotaxis-related protein WspB